MPNKTQQDLILGIVILAITIIIAGWSLFTSFPKKADLPVVTTAPAISTDVFQEPVVNNLQSENLNGPLPITVSPEDEGRENPFAGF